MSKIRLATIWLDGCSGCHMSFLDQDERLIDLADRIDLVYSPLVDAKEFPENVDITLIEGAVSSPEDVAKVRKIRERTKFLISFGDCAVTGNVPSMRNPFGIKEVLESVYIDREVVNPVIPSESIPHLFNRVRPVHREVRVDLFIPGCPPSADTIHTCLVELLAGRVPDVNKLSRFGA